MSKLHAHFKEMQGMCSRYLEPAVYVALNGMTAKGEGDAAMRDKLFISDMIWMLDGSEQREAQGEQA